MRDALRVLLGPTWTLPRIGAFVLYAIVLFAATHWPALTIPSDVIERPDLLIHFVAFSGWYLAFWQSGLIGPPLRWKSVMLSYPISIAYAAVDEGSQAIPWLRRTCAWDDFAANCGGVTIGFVVASVLVLLMRRSAGKDHA